LSVGLGQQVDVRETLDAARVSHRWASAFRFRHGPFHACWLLSLANKAQSAGFGLPEFGERFPLFGGLIRAREDACRVVFETAGAKGSREWHLVFCSSSFAEIRSQRKTGSPLQA
jgi:hypothetical protein